MVTTERINHAIPVAKTLPIHRGWLRGLGLDRSVFARTDGVRSFNNSGSLFIDQNGQFSPLPSAGAARHFGTLGIVVSQNENEANFQSFVAALPLLGPKGVKSASWTQRLGTALGLDQSEHARNIIEISQAPNNPAKLVVYERRMETLGARVQDRSKHLYKILIEKIELNPRLRAEFSQIVDTRDIRKVVVNPDKSVTIHYQAPEKEELKITLPGNCFRDNHGQPLLDNPKFDLTGVADIYQRDAYSIETTIFQPEIGTFDGQLALVVHKVFTYEIDKPASLQKVGGPFQVFPATGYSAVEVEDGKWLPINDFLANPAMISKEQSALVETNMPATVNCQNRIGNEATLVYQMRDIYFYGLGKLYNSYQTRLRYGLNFGLNFFKGLVERGINSGRTYTESAVAIFRSPWTKPMETNNEYYNKIMSHGQEVEPPGVSEDHQRATKLVLEGMIMFITKTLDNIMSAEGNADPSGWGPVNNQNTNRYNLSEQLAYVLTKVIGHEVKFGNLTSPAFSNFQQLSEVFALRFWYKLPFAEVMKQLAAPVLVGTNFMVPFLPVDSILFITTWMQKNVASFINYSLHLKTLGLRVLKDGFWNNPSIELSFLRGYWQAAWNQFYERNQFSVFIMTHSGRGQTVPKSNQATVLGLGAVSGSAFAYGLWQTIATSGAIFDGLFAIPFAINFFFCGFQTALCLKSFFMMRDASKNKIAQKNINDYATEKREDYLDFQTIMSEMNAGLNTGNPTYNDLFAHRAALKRLLINLDAINEKGRVAIEKNNAYGLLANEMLDLLGTVEMAIATKAAFDLKNNAGDQAARQAVHNLIIAKDGTRNMVVVDTLSRLFVKLQIAW